MPIPSKEVQFAAIEIVKDYTARFRQVNTLINEHQQGGSSALWTEELRKLSDQKPHDLIFGIPEEDPEGNIPKLLLTDPEQRMQAALKIFQSKILTSEITEIK